MLFKLGCNLHYDVAEPASGFFNVRAAETDQQRVVKERLVLTPNGGDEQYVMPESGNRYDRVKLLPGAFELRYEAIVDLKVQKMSPAEIGEIPVGKLPFEVLPHLQPSRYCQSDRMLHLAERTFGKADAGHLRVTEVCNWIYDHVDYVRGSSDEHTSAMDTLVDHAGVCRDFAHLGVAICRALGIPARFASCYAWQLEPADFHAVFEAYLGGRWFLFDATRQAALDGLVRIGVGRDAADVAFASFAGNVTPGEMKVWIDPVDASVAETRTVDAVSAAAT